MSNDKEGLYIHEICAAPTQNSRINLGSLAHGMCGPGGSIYNKGTIQIHSLLALAMIDPSFKTLIQT
jgi:hypothetical protein